MKTAKFKPATNGRYFKKKKEVYQESLNEMVRQRKLDDEINPIGDDM